MLPLLKLGQAVFATHWNGDEELRSYIKTSKQAAQVLSLSLSETTIQDICAAFPEDFDVQFQAALQDLYKNPDQCADKTKELLAVSPAHPCLYAMLAIASQAKPAEAAMAMEKQLEIWPDEPDWHAIAGSLYEQQAEYDLAAKHLEEAIRILPKQAQYWQTLGDIKVLEKDFHAARDYFGKAIELFPDNPEVLASLAVINQQLGEYHTAIECLRKAEELDPQNPEYGEAIAECYLAIKDYSSALEQAQRTLQSKPRSPRALLAKIKSLMGKRQFDEARP